MAATSTPLCKKSSMADTFREPGLFPSTAPLGFAGGDTNLKRYCGNSPTNATDPSGLAPPPGTKKNHYDGVGEWKFTSVDDAVAFLQTALNTSNVPRTWVSCFSRGCVGLNFLWIGTAGVAGPMDNALGLKTTTLYTNEGAAQAAIAALATSNPGSKYILFAVQLPTR